MNEREVQQYADKAAVPDEASAAYYADDGIDGAPCDVWWDSTKDAWCDGYETGFLAALKALGIDGDEDPDEVLQIQAPPSLYDVAGNDIKAWFHIKDESE